MYFIKAYLCRKKADFKKKFAGIKKAADSDGLPKLSPCRIKVYKGERGERRAERGEGRGERGERRAERRERRDRK